MAGLEEWSSLGEPPLGGNPGTEFGLSSFCGGSFIGWGSAPDPGSALAGAPGPRSDCLAGSQVLAVSGWALRHNGALVRTPVGAGEGTAVRVDPWCERGGGVNDERWKGDS